MIPDIVVRHCVLTVRGRGGWGWGSDASGYLARALPAIEQALERLLRESDLDPQADVWIEEPMRLFWGQDGTLADGLREHLVAQIKQEAGAAVEGDPPVTQPEIPREGEAVGSSTVPRPTEVAVDGAVAVASLLGAWSKSGLIREIVASWPAAVVALWLEAVGRAADATDRADLDASAVKAIAELVLTVERSHAEQTRADVRLLVLIAALIAAADNRPLGRTTLDEAVRLTDSSGGDDEGLTRSASPGPPTDPRSASEIGTSTAHTSIAIPNSLGRVPRQRVVVPGLPFLVMVQLSRIGYLHALAAVAEVAGEPVAAQLIAAGVAGKVLPPPERGWRRHRTEIDAIAWASGLTLEDADSAAYISSAPLELLVPPLQSALIALYAAGRSSVDEVVVTKTSEGSMCGEAVGALPIAWVPGTDDLDSVRDQLGRPPLRRSDLFAPLIRELTVRSAFPHLHLPGIERHIGAVVGAAMGSLAQELWGMEVPNAPLVALERLADLEVELRFEDVMAVAIPRGQRWLDLGRAGLLDHWLIPWAEGMHWELVSW